MHYRTSGQLLADRRDEQERDVKAARDWGQSAEDAALLIMSAMPDPVLTELLCALARSGQRSARRTHTVVAGMNEAIAVGAMCKLVLIHILGRNGPQTELPTVLVEVWSHTFVGSKTSTG